MIKITDKTNCCGCGACSAVCPAKCIAMKEDSDGFIYPTVDESLCLNCSKCDTVCSMKETETETSANPKCYAAYALDETIRLSSSSGGVFSLIAKKIFDKNGIAFGVGMSEDFRKAVYFTAENEDETIQMRGSKYIQSDSYNTYGKVKNCLESGRTLLFVGTPCQVSGLRSFLGKEYSNLFTIDFVCHGVPSSFAWNKYISKREKEAKSAITAVSFRNKEQSWKNYSINIEFDNGTKYTVPKTKDTFLLSFVTDYCLRPSCHKCNFRSLEHSSDITIGDFWEIEKIDSSFTDDKGVSLIICNSESGKMLFSQIKDEIFLKEESIDSVIQCNESIINNPIITPKREIFLNSIKTKDFDEAVKCCYYGSKYVRLKKKIKKIIKVKK